MMKSLKNKAQFDFVYKNSMKFDGGGFHSYILTFSHPVFKKRQFSFKDKAIFTHLASEYRSTYIGLSVSKKIGNAPMRNKIKRWFRSFCRIYRDLLIGKAVVFVAKDSSTLSYSVIEENMLKALRRGSEDWRKS